MQALQTTVERQQKQIAAQEESAAQQQKQIEALTSTVQKVSDQLQLNKRGPEVATNDQ